MANTLTIFSPQRQAEILELLKQKHVEIAQLDRPTHQRTVTARNYDSGIRALGEHMAAKGVTMPTKGFLESWRESMLNQGLAVKTVNARLAATRKLLRSVSDDVTDLHVKIALRDWATVADAKKTVFQDKTDQDYGRRLTLQSLQELISRIPTNTIKGLRDRAIIALGAGAGLRVSEIVNLTLSDVLDTVNEAGQRGIRVRKGKHNKSRIVVVDGWNSWVIQAVEAYAVNVEYQSREDKVICGVKPVRGGRFITAGKSLSVRQAQAIFEGENGYLAEYRGEFVQINMHDLRRTFAKLCRQSGMSWDALREQMGHNSVTTTEAYVGHEVDWSERIPNWSIKL